MADKLTDYKKKRDFTKTTEPKGQVKTTKNNNSKNLKFVVQYHEATRAHYDFRLEYGGTLLSWAVPKGASFLTTDKRLAVRVEDHPIDYATFEGTIPKGEYGGGTVMLWDEGTYEPVYDFNEGLKKGALKFTLFGKRLKGIWNLVKSTRAEKQDVWFLIKHGDEYAQSDSGISAFTVSVATGRTMEEIATGAKSRKRSKTVEKERKPSIEECTNPFSHADVMTAELADKIPEGDEWLFEVKYDGMRALAFAADGEVKLFSRNNNDITAKFSGVTAEISRLSRGGSFVLDGEIAVADESGRTDFHALQRHMRGGESAPCFMAFDVLALGGEDLRSSPLLDRKKALHGIIGSSDGAVRESGYVIGRGKESFDAVKKLGMEGVVGKRIHSVYGEKGSWVKIKCTKRQEFVVGGWVAKSGHKMSSLLLGYYEDKKLIYCGKTGTGFSEKDRTEIAEILSGMEAEESPFASPPKATAHERIYWTKPEKIAEIGFAEFTADGALRHASFIGFREDKEPRSIKREYAAINAKEAEDIVCGIKITSPDRESGAGVGVKKIDAARYYEQAAERMLPHLGKRILSVVRCHGDGKPCFFKKHPSDGQTSILRVDIGGDDYFYIENAKGLISEVQSGTIEFHCWGSRANKPDLPDTMVFDLDPDEGTDLSQVRQGALDLKCVLEELSLISFIKTSGGKGYHIVLPVSPSVAWAEFKAFARRIAEMMAERWRNKYTANSRIAARKDKIYIDWMRNGRGATSVAPYSLRARAGGGVSVPISWEELESIAPDGINIAGALERLGKPDPWQDYFKVSQSLAKAIRAVKLGVRH